MENQKSTVIFCSIILITGILTIVTDLKIKKIYNNHLIIGSVLGLAAVIYTALWAHEDILFHIINGLIAFVIGACCYRFGLWRGGDAKLFMLYAFLLPSLTPGHVLLSSAINLFACSFIAGAIILIPVFIRDFALNRNAIINSYQFQNLLNATRITMMLSWGFFPIYYFAIYYLAKIVYTPIISLAVTYIIFYLARHFLVKIKIMRVNYMLALSGFTCGFLARLWLSPHSLSWTVLPYSILRIGLFSCLSACIYATPSHLKEYQDRISFAPLLFIGCVLSFTPFLTWIMNLMRLIRQ